LSGFGTASKSCLAFSKALRPDPVPALMDIDLFRPSDGNWFIVRATRLLYLPDIAIGIARHLNYRVSLSELFQRGSLAVQDLAIVCRRVAPATNQPVKTNLFPARIHKLAPSTPRL